MDTIARRRAKQHIMSWGSGHARPDGFPAGQAATVVLADRAHLDDAVSSGVIGGSTVAFAPGTGDGPIVGYDGALDEPGTEFALGHDFYLQTQDYATSAYMTVLGPTIVRLFTSEDFAACLRDADRALEEGVFPEFLITPSVLLADTSGLGGGPGGDGPLTRLYADRAGNWSTSPRGAVLGTMGDSLDTLTARYDEINAASPAPCAVALAAVISDPDRSAALRERPYLRRYLAAVRALRSVIARGAHGPKVSGFGVRLVPGLALEGPDIRDAEAPLVMFTEEEAYVFAAGRLFSVSRDVAGAVECLLAGEADPDSAERLSQVRDYFTQQGVSLPEPVVAV
ncbi:daptide biosynthesis RiPP recognition protein [Streptomyces sp. NPDC021098]|uniref:daptide biosynthesis RiPP recognition protein n=1 Tax=unclassified Streptomyces TaxID=2593676 RepID=UPI00378EB314